MYSVFRDLAIIILSAKFFGLVARKCKAPQVVGEILAGLIIGPCVLNLVQTSDAISTFAEIGVVMLMFTTGLGTNLKELIKAGPIATLIACVGVFVPLAGGTLLYSAFYGFSAVGSPEFYRALFIGTIMTATSVSITVATLQELGHLKSFLGTTIVSAAVIDDVIGIVVLTCVLGASSGTGTGLGKVLINTALFFATSSSTPVLMTPLLRMPSICSGVLMSEREGTVFPLFSQYITFLSSSVGSCPGRQCQTLFFLNTIDVFIYNNVLCLLFLRKPYAVPYPNRSSLLLLAVSKDDSFF